MRIGFSVVWDHQQFSFLSLDFFQVLFSGRVCQLVHCTIIRWQKPKNEKLTILYVRNNFQNNQPTSSCCHLVCPDLPWDLHLGNNPNCHYWSQAFFARLDLTHHQLQSTRNIYLYNHATLVIKTYLLLEWFLVCLKAFVGLSHGSYFWSQVVVDCW